MYEVASDMPLLVSEYGIDAYNTNVNHPDYNESWFDKRMVGFEDMPTQAEWLLSLTEDLERHSSACQYGCAPEADRVCVGGSIMAWVDEWWKGV